MPTYVTIKDVKRRWGHGQEDVFPVAQFEKLWGDLTSLPDLPCAFLAVDRRRGQQLKDAAQLDGWVDRRQPRPRRILCAVLRDRVQLDDLDRSRSAFRPTDRSTMSRPKRCW